MFDWSGSPYFAATRCCCRADIHPTRGRPKQKLQQTNVTTQSLSIKCELLRFSSRFVCHLGPLLVCSCLNHAVMDRACGSIAQQKIYMVLIRSMGHAFDLFTQYALLIMLLAPHAPAYLHKGLLTIHMHLAGHKHVHRSGSLHCQVSDGPHSTA
jgi:hypothetical protein